MRLHTFDPVCPECEKKLATAHPLMRDWFRKKKAKYPDLHCAWAYRNEEEQKACLLAGTTNVEFPNSPHNHKDEAGLPCSIALDVFRIGADGVGRWSSEFYRTLDAENVADQEPILWGGKFKRRFDGPHFELIQERKVA